MAMAYSQMKQMFHRYILEVSVPLTYSGLIHNSLFSYISGSSLCLSPTNLDIFSLSRFGYRSPTKVNKPVISPEARFK